MPRACGESIRPASSSAASRSAATLVDAGRPAVARWAASMARARAMRKGSPARRASSRPRVWKSAPRIGSIMHSPATADQQRSIRVRSIGGDLALVARRGTGGRGAGAAPGARGARARARRASRACVMPSGPSRVRKSASPSSTWPLIRSWVEASRFSSRVSAAVAERGRLQVGLRRLGAPAGVGQRVAQLLPEEPRLVVRPRVQLERRSDRAAPRGRTPAPRRPGRRRGE